MCLKSYSMWKWNLFFLSFFYIVSRFSFIILILTFAIDFGHVVFRAVYSSALQTSSLNSSLFISDNMCCCIFERITFAYRIHLMPLLSFWQRVCCLNLHICVGLQHSAPLKVWHNQTCCWYYHLLKCMLGYGM